MATRRQLGMGGEREDDGSGDFYDDAGQIQGIDGLASKAVNVDEFGNVIPDFSNDPNYPKPFVDYQPDEIAGNTETGRGLAGPSANPTISKPIAPTPQAPSMQLPQGVSVDERFDAASEGGMFADPPFGDAGVTESMPTPMMPREPAPVSSRTPSPLNAPTESSFPARRSAVSPSIFGESSQPTMFGRADGLLGGGKGLAGASETSGALAPTEMMQKLLQMFRQQGS